MASHSFVNSRNPNGLWSRIARFLRQWATFFQAFARQPAMIGSVIPSSPALVAAMLAPVDWKPVRLFVEYGPGLGTFTRPVLDRLPPDAMLIAIDTNEGFVRHLTAEIADRRFRAVHGSAADVRRIIAGYGFAQADYILSGLPFSTLPEGVDEAIARETRLALRPGGTFLVYQYSQRVRRLLERHFDRIESGLEWLNIPPCRMFWAHREAALAQAA
jgi:phospholipid N-methyltransferase